MTTNDIVSRLSATTDLPEAAPPRWPDPKPRISVMVVDSQTLFRTGLARLLGDDDRLQVVAASDGHRQLPEMCAALAVDVVVTDLQLPEMDGIELTRLIAGVSPDTRTLILATSVDWRVIPALGSGAAGFLLKDAEPEAIISAVVAVHLGEKVLCHEATQWLIQEAPARRLTRRETEVLRLVSAGADNQQIAVALEIGPKTVRNYVSRLYHKLESQDRGQMATYAALAGIGGHRSTGASDNPGPHLTFVDEEAS